MPTRRAQNTGRSERVIARVESRGAERSPPGLRSPRARTVPIAFINEANHLAALRLLVGADDGAFTASQRQAQAMLFLDMRQNGILLAHIFWGLWLLPLGMLIFRSGFLPKLIGVLVAFSGVTYVIDAGTQLLFPGQATISQFTFIGEVLLALWLLIKGVNVARWQQVARVGVG